jgi:hypothetical protein
MRFAECATPESLTRLHALCWYQTLILLRATFCWAYYYESNSNEKISVSIK